MPPPTPSAAPHPASTPAPPSPQQQQQQQQQHSSGQQHTPPQQHQQLQQQQKAPPHPPPQQQQHQAMAAVAYGGLDPDDVELSPAATTVAFAQLLPPLRVPVRAGPADVAADVMGSGDAMGNAVNGRGGVFDAAEMTVAGTGGEGKGSGRGYVLAFEDEGAWRRSWGECERKLQERCQAGARVGCSLAATSKCKPPWWATILQPRDAAKQDEEERARESCEEKEMMACFAASKDHCAVQASERCGPIFSEDVLIARDVEAVHPRFLSRKGQRTLAIRQRQRQAAEAKGKAAASTSSAVAAAAVAAAAGAAGVGGGGITLEGSGDILGVSIPGRPRPPSDFEAEKSPSAKLAQMLREQNALARGSSSNRIGGDGSSSGSNVQNDHSSRSSAQQQSNRSTPNQNSLGGEDFKPRSNVIRASELVHSSKAAATGNSSPATAAAAAATGARAAAAGSWESNGGLFGGEADGESSTGTGWEGGLIKPRVKRSSAAAGSGRAAAAAAVAAPSVSSAAAATPTARSVQRQQEEVGEELFPVLEFFRALRRGDAPPGLGGGR